MKLVTRYVVREHVGPLLFALSALTSLLMLQYVARQLANLAGKGLPWRAIVEFFVLSLPFTIAMTLPMAVLVATLFAFGRMAAEHEITAFKANGVRVRALMVPVLVCAFLLSCAMVAFNDLVLPRANHRLRILQQDIARTKPTLALRDQAMNAITDQFYMRVARSNAATNQMFDVTIYDLSLGTSRKTVYADSGLFLMSPNGKDLQLRLYDGHSQEFVRGDPRRFQRTFFREQTVQLSGITQGFEASRSDQYKGDREMSICEMQRKYAVSAKEFARIRQEYIMYASRLVAPGTKAIRVPRGRPLKDALSDFYCVTVPSWFKVKTAQAAEAPRAVWQPATQQPPVQQPPAKPPTQTPPVLPGQAGKVPEQGPVRPPQRNANKNPQPKSTAPVPDPNAPPPTLPGQQVVTPPNQAPQNAQPVPRPAGQPPVNQPVILPPPGQVQIVPPVTPPQQFDSLGRPIQPGVVPQPGQTVAPPAGDSAHPVVTPVPAAPTDTIAMFRGSMLAAQTQLNEAREGIDSLAVEIQKKFALSFACLVFVLFGPPIALRFPRGGVGVTIGVSIVVFGLYYICLMGGEALADKGKLPAIVAMWIANFTFALVGIVLLWRVESTTDSSRGGGIRDWWHDRQVRRELARERNARSKTADAPAVPA